MNKAGKAIFGILGAVLLCGPAIHAAEPTTIANLTETSVKISEIDMDKDFGNAGSLLDSFYAGTLTKGNQASSVVYTDKNAPARPSASAEAVCNAKPSKLVLSGKVPPPHTTPKSDRKKHSLPLTTGSLILGGVSLLAAASGKKKSYMDDVETVWNAIQHPVDTYNDINNYDSNMQNYNNSTNQNNNSSNQNNSPSTPYEVEQDAATTLHCDPTGTCTQ